MIKIFFDKEYKENKTIFIYMGKAEAGIHDLRRIKTLFPSALSLSRKDSSFWSTVIQCKNINNIVYIHSSPWNIFHKLITILNKHFIIIHNPPGFISNKSLKGKIDNIILSINLLIFKNLIFISNHVMEKYSINKKKMMLTNKHYVNYGIMSKNQIIDINKKPPSIFFFGRYLPYKNLEIFINLATKTNNINFYVYSHGCPNYQIKNLKVNNKWIDENKVKEIFTKHDILITPYSETSQSGPFFLGLEYGKIIIAPKIEGFNEYSDYDRLVHYYPNNITMLENALKEAIYIYQCR